ncbi:MAG: zinc dependent phospholipase C family protein [Lachnospiraceae bacterium]|nr:zinc dependent phospholipase C family protein [Lachnospiraceae bacterium]
MRKKSHIALSEYLAEEMHLEDLNIHRKAFCFGSILPDLNPKMLADPHEFNTSWDKVKSLILQIEADAKSDDYNSRVMWRHIGVVLHYLADYFTYPHNSSFEGSLKEHCLHESELKYLLRAYLCTPEAAKVFDRQRLCARRIHTAQQLFDYIERIHDSYMSQSDHSVLSDCYWIVELCSLAGAVLASMVCGDEAPEAWMQLRLV